MLKMVGHPDKQSRSPSDTEKHHLSAEKKRELALDLNSPSAKRKTRKQQQVTHFDRNNKKALRDKHKKFNSKHTTSERKIAIQRKQQRKQSYFDVPEFGTISSEESDGKDFIELQSEVEVVDLCDEFDEDNVESEDCSMQQLKNGVHFMKLQSSPMVNTSLLIHLHPTASFQLTGKARIHVLNGSVEVFGYYIHENTKAFEIYSQQQQTTIQCISSDNEPSDNLRDSTNLMDSVKRHIQGSELNRLLKIGALLVLEAFETEWSSGFRSLVGNDGRQLIGERVQDADDDDEDPFTDLGFQLHSEPDEDFELQIPSAWIRLYENENIVMSGDQERPFRLAAFGPQNSGKSTLTKWMTNKLLNNFESVLYVDLDPGQPEFTPPGVISIVKCIQPKVGANYTHLMQPTKSVFIGTINVADSPLTYLRGIQQLANFIKTNSDLKNLPIILNTIGFTRGLGLDLAIEVIKMFKLTAVVQLSLSTKVDYELDLVSTTVSQYKGIFKTSAEGILGYSFHKIDSVYRHEDEVQTLFLDRKKQRDYLILSYFAKLIKDGTLESCVPYIVPLAAITIWLESEAFPNDKESHAKVLNGSLVALCHCDDSSTANSGQASDGDSIAFSSFIGYGLVRAIDMKQELLYILTPIPTGVLKDVNYLVPAGNALQIPMQLLNNFNSNSVKAERPYMMSPHKHRINSRLHNVTKKYFAPNRVATHSLLKRCLL